MPSFDIVSEITMHEVRNAVENAQRDLSNRWDFKNVQASIELNEKTESIKLSTESDFQLEQLLDILRNACIKRGIDSSSLDIPTEF
ncbi:PF04461 domain protein [Pasteurella bettyae CCUG 2042]|uniref:PF04461 domain protein n=1 Tax=Pasteurella bettyae CCUG 2042 TaxID=1095749 RepID=I3DFD3_9PAST|nr:PF04461 domain protein [Pasteurella bettyae CCUG 2042]SUB21058.1 nucleotide-binding protein [Pasteurella bettyae]